ncbi:MAG: Ldh family oxidoreductase [Ignavibacteriales bacterium]|nr:Ldh family oxidoreductase [Ignavibacteriales bacterium]
MAEHIRIEQTTLIRQVEEILQKAGVPLHIAHIEAEIMTESDLMGVPSHGVCMLPALLKGMEKGKATSNPNMRIVKEHKATCVIDGDNGPGRYVSLYAMNIAIERAKEFGIGACLATNVTHWGRAFAYAFRAAQASTIGICTTNTIPNTLGWNSTKPLLGNNPLSIGVPRPGQDPIVLDISMSQAAHGKIAIYAREGKEVPLGWGLDSEGKSTTNPNEILKSHRLLPFGGHKGAGLAMMMELLTGALAGTELSHEILQIERGALNPGTTKLFIALDVSSFSSLEAMGIKIEQFALWLHETEPGVLITFPGDRSWQSRRENLQHGIPLHPDIANELRKIGVNL